MACFLLIRWRRAWLGRRAWLAFAVAISAATPSHAASVQTTVERVRAQGYLSCGSVSRPGLAQVEADQWSGLEVEVCRAVAIAVLGKTARFTYHQYESEKDFTAIRDGGDQLAFLTYSEIASNGLTDKVLPGPAVFVESNDVMVEAASPIRHLADLGGNSTCFIIQTAAEQNLNAWLADHKLDVMRHAYQEEGEMYDAFAVQRCKSVAGEATALAEARLDRGVNRLRSRLLPDHLATFPVVAATSLKDDSQWAAIVAWTIHTLVAANQQESYFHADGLRATAVAGEGLGLAAGWQKTVVATVGCYDAIFRRTLGEQSPFKLEVGANASVEQGGTFLVPHRE